MALKLTGKEKSKQEITLNLEVDEGLQPFKIKVEAITSGFLKHEKNIPDKDKSFFHSTEVDLGVINKILTSEGLKPKKGLIFLTENLLYALNMSELIDVERITDSIPKRMATNFFILLINVEGKKLTKTGKEFIIKPHMVGLSRIPHEFTTNEIAPDDVVGFFKVRLSIKTEKEIPFVYNYFQLLSLLIKKLLSEDMSKILGKKNSSWNDFRFDKEIKNVEQINPDIIKEAFGKDIKRILGDNII